MKNNIIDNKNVQSDNNPAPQEVLDYFLNNSSKESKNDLKNDEDKGISIPLSELENAGLTKINDPEADNSSAYKDAALIPPSIEDELFDTSIYEKSNESDIKRIFTDLSKVTITDNEKENYLRTLLDGTTKFMTYIHFDNSKISICAASKTIEEQDFIRDMVMEFSKEVDQNNQPKHTVVEGIEHLLKLNAIVTFIYIFPREETLEATIKLGLEKINKMDKNYWFFLLNALRIFEQKEVLLGELMASGDF